MAKCFNCGHICLRVASYAVAALASGLRTRRFFVHVVALFIAVTQLRNHLGLFLAAAASRTRIRLCAVCGAGRFFCDAALIPDMAERFHFLCLFDSADSAAAVHCCSGLCTRRLLQHAVQLPAVLALRQIQVGPELLNLNSIPGNRRINIEPLVLMSFQAADCDRCIIALHNLCAVSLHIFLSVPLRDPPRCRAAFEIFHPVCIHNRQNLWKLFVSQQNTADFLVLMDLILALAVCMLQFSGVLFFTDTIVPSGAFFPDLISIFIHRWRSIILKALHLCNQTDLRIPVCGSAQLRNTVTFHFQFFPGVFIVFHDKTHVICHCHRIILFNGTIPEKWIKFMQIQHISKPRCIRCSICICQLGRA